MDFTKLSVEGATPRDTRTFSAVAVDPLLNDAGKPFIVSGVPLAVSILPTRGVQWEAEQGKWLAKWGGAARFVDHPDMTEDEAAKRADHQLRAFRELTARKMAGWNIAHEGQTVEATLANRADLLEHWPEIADAIEREAARVTAEVGNSKTG